MFSLFAQDVKYAREVLETLASPNYYGRGYVKHGDKKAAKYIAREFEKNKLQAFGNDYFQSYSFPINSFPGKLEVSIDGKELIPGIDYVISSSSASVNKTYRIVDMTEEGSNMDSLFPLMQQHTDQSIFFLGDKNMRKHYGRTIPGIEAVALITDKTPYWHVSNARQVEETVWLKIRKDKIPKNASELHVQAKNKYFTDYPTQNVVAFVPGKKSSDEYIVFTAHYDHLGMMGKDALYPGANDNASGVAVLLDLARHYALAENQTIANMVFIAFSGEEAGLYGSNYFADHPIFPLENIKVLVNLDMVGTGSEGITIVNGAVLPEVFDQFDNINTTAEYISEVKSRGESCNSDHCPFYEKGVPAVFIYTRGKENQQYHLTTDVAADYPFSTYDGLFHLLTDFVSSQ